MSAKTCPICGAPLDPERRADAAFCSTRCRVTAHRRKQREAADKALARELGISLEKLRRARAGR